MRLLRVAIISIFITSVCFLSAGLSVASVVTIDMAGKTATSDDATLEMFGVQFSEQQAGVCVNNKLADPQKFTLRCTGLTEPEYTLYINGASKGVKSLQQLQQGLQLVVDGSVADPGMIRCLSSISPAVQKLHGDLKDSTSNEEQTVWNTMRQVLDWAKLTMDEDQTWRSIRVIIAPKEKPLEKMEWTLRHSDYDTAVIISGSCWALQQTRDQLYHQLQNATLRNDAIAALTPVEFSASYAVRKGKPHVYAKLLNKCDVPLKGTLSLALPAGWKAPNAKLKFSQLKSGQTFVLSCDLVAPSKSVAAPCEVPITANILVIQLDKSAAMKLTAVATAAGK